MSTTTPSAAPSFPPGWYDFPDRANTRGYWDGQAWTGDYAPIASPIPVSTTVSPERESAGALVVIGYITAVLMPIVGFILGIVVATRPAKVTSKHGAWIIVLSIVAFVVYLALIIHGAQTTTTASAY